MKSETGGFFTCRLNLNLQTFKTEIAPIGIERYEPDKKPKIPSAEQIKKSLDRIYPIPQVALKILRLVDQDDYDLEDIASEVKKDDSRLAEALGQDLLVQLVVSAAVRGFFNLRGYGYSLCKGGLFFHAVGTAQVAAILATTTKKISASLAYTAGLLHDIGKVVLDQFISSAYPLFYRNLMEKDKDILDIEQEILGVDHTVVGSILANKWSFPNSLTQVIQNHHYPEKEEKYVDLAHILFLADLLITKFHPGLELERMDDSRVKTRLQKIGLSMDQLPGIVDSIPPSVFLNSSELMPPC